jgi:hypothetical protein
MIKNAQNQPADRVCAFLIIEVGTGLGRSSEAGPDGRGWRAGLAAIPFS